MHKTIIFISHDLNEALKLGDRIILMKDGYIVQEGTAESILRTPANDYVAKFVQDVDISKVVTAESIMKNPGEVASFAHDGPKAALWKMRQAGLSSIYVQHKNRLVGLVRAEDASSALKAGERDLRNILVTDIHRCRRTRRPTSSSLSWWRAAGRRGGQRRPPHGRHHKGHAPCGPCRRSTDQWIG